MASTDNSPADSTMANPAPTTDWDALRARHGKGKGRQLVNRAIAAEIAGGPELLAAIDTLARLSTTPAPDALSLAIAATAAASKASAGSSHAEPTRHAYAVLAVLSSAPPAQATPALYAARYLLSPPGMPQPMPS